MYSLNHCPLELASSTRTEILCKVATVPGQQCPVVKFRFNPSGRTSETGFNSITRVLGNRPGATEMTTPLDPITATKNPPHPGSSPQPAPAPSQPAPTVSQHLAPVQRRPPLGTEEHPPLMYVGWGQRLGQGVLEGVAGSRAKALKIPHPQMLANTVSLGDVAFPPMVTAPGEQARKTGRMLLHPNAHRATDLTNKFLQVSYEDLFLHVSASMSIPPFFFPCLPALPT